MDNLKKIVAAALLVLSLTLGYSWANTQSAHSAAASGSQISSGEVTINTAAPPSVTDRPGAGEPTPTPTPTPEP